MCDNMEEENSSKGQRSRWRSKSPSYDKNGELN